MRSVLGIAVILLTAGQVYAQFNLLSDNRSVSIAGGAGGSQVVNTYSGSQTPSSSFVDFHGKVNEAADWQTAAPELAQTHAESMVTQESTATQGQLNFDSHITVAAWGDFGIEPKTVIAMASSLFQVSFSVDSTLTFDLLFNFAAPAGSGFDYSFGLDLTSSSQSSILGTPSWEIAGWQYSGSLEPGEVYTLTVSHQISTVIPDPLGSLGDNSLTMNFTVVPQASPVPEPSTSLLLGLALVGFIVMQFKKAQKQTICAMALQRIKRDTRPR